MIPVHRLPTMRLTWHRVIFPALTFILFLYNAHIQHCMATTIGYPEHPVNSSPSGTCLGYLIFIVGYSSSSQCLRFMASYGSRLRLGLVMAWPFIIRNYLAFPLGEMQNILPPSHCYFSGNISKILNNC